jgi:hypothetical protein
MQSVHEAPPVLGWNLPTGQSEHKTEAAMANLPAAQIVHSSAL